jgi:hypothetical protein
MTVKQAGKKNFNWFFARVEDRDDPLQLGRFRIRCFNLHTEDKAKLPTDMLPWATPIQPVSSAAFGEIGASPTGIVVGSTVMGFFADDEEGQIPIILGTFAGIPRVDDKDAHDVAQRARGIDNLKNEYVEDVEPSMAFKAKYPYNKTYTSESNGGKGMILEVDDTPSHERLLAWHLKGSYVEINQDGRLVVKAVDNSHYLTVKDNVIYVGGNCTIVVVGDAGIAVGGNCSIQVDGSVTANVGVDLTANVAGNMTANVVGTLILHSDSDMKINSDSNIEIEASGNIKIKGSRIDLN